MKPEVARRSSSRPEPFARTDSFRYDDQGLVEHLITFTASSSSSCSPSASSSHRCPRQDSHRRRHRSQGPGDQPGCCPYSSPSSAEKPSGCQRRHPGAGSVTRRAPGSKKRGSDTVFLVSSVLAASVVVLGVAYFLASRPDPPRNS